MIIRFFVKNVKLKNLVIDPIRLMSESNVLGQYCSGKTYSYEEKIIGEKSGKECAIQQ